MDNFFLRRRRPSTSCLAVAVIVVVGCLIAWLLVQALTTHTEPGTRRPAATLPAGIAPGDDDTLTAGPLRVLAGRAVVKDVPVGFPHTTAGAVSAAVHYWGQIGSTLKPARAYVIGRIVADPAWKTAPQDLAQGPVHTRRMLGLPTAGPVPQGAAVRLTPMAYQLRDVTPDAVFVLLLAYYETTVPGWEPETGPGVFPAQLRWIAGDWKLPAPTQDADYSELRAPPGSAEAMALGWRPLWY
ncbi:hypothetical protein SAMN04489712_105513 [Thermomonospora echinospora]|uniref:DUF8175 domain-containing protein n=1 Tax=Thermomonospora echinospora TaxID=1992 RepID=A0A1H6AK46_9ACTN|nr:hypothetical protein [Thermomonospora echinospora]SEG49078.1 hypothetical protein SAMN04489712_105513 [Thermomonospora echinospora]